MFGLSGTELAVILVLALLLLGPSKLPQVARTVGKGVRDFRRATDDLRHSVESEFYRMEDAGGAKQAAVPSLQPPEGAPVPVAGATPEPAAAAASSSPSGPTAAAEAAPAAPGGEVPPASAPAEKA